MTKYEVITHRGKEFHYFFSNKREAEMFLMKESLKVQIARENAQEFLDNLPTDWSREYLDYYIEKAKERLTWQEPEIFGREV